MKKNYTNILAIKRFLFLFLSIFLAASTYTFAQVSGTVFRDGNGDGIYQSSEPLIAGLTINAYNTLGTLCGTTISTTSSSPNYSITGCSGSIRLEFIIPPSSTCNVNGQFDFSTVNGTGSKTSIQFVTAPSNGNNFGLLSNDFYVKSSNPTIFVPCYVNGWGAKGSTSGDGDAFVNFSYNSTGVPQMQGGSAPNPVHLAYAYQIGSTWGVAYSKQAKRVFLSAFMKRHVGMGPDGSGAIYKIDPTSPPADNIIPTFTSLDALGFKTQAAGSYVATPSGFNGVIGSNTSNRGLSSNKTQPSNDPSAFGQVGKVSLGDLDISDDGQYLYTVNLFDRKIYQIDLQNPTNPVTPTATQVKEYTNAQMPWISQSCANGIARPFALKYYRGSLYVGVVCTGETGTYPSGNPKRFATDLRAYIYKIDPSGASATTVAFEFPLNYDKESTSSGDDSPVNGWYAWTDKWSEFTSPYYGSGTGGVSHPQPIFADIEFDIDGSVIMSFMDRGGHQTGVENYPPSGTTFHSCIIGGDILRAYKNPTNCEFELEANGKVGPLTSSSQAPVLKDGVWSGSGPSSPNGTGATFTGYYQTGTSGTLVNNTPGGKGREFYWGDFANLFGNNYPTPHHNEGVMGGLALWPSSGEVLVVGMDPVDNEAWSGGVYKLSNTNGSRISGYNLYTDSSPSNTQGAFGKANGLGDVEITSEIPPIEIGNRVWLDTDKDGIQDAGEAGISGITVTLCLASAPTTAVSTAVTDANGNYYFSSATGTSTASAKYGVNIAFGTGYILKFPTTSGVNSISPNIGAGSNVLIDSDATSAGTIALTTGSAGQNNHSFDVAYSTCTTPTAVSITKSPTGTVAGGAAINLTANATGTDAATTYAWSGPSGFSSTIQSPSTTAPATAGTYTYSVTISNGGTCTATATSTLSVTVAVACTPITNLTASVSPTTVITGGAVNLSSAGTGLLAGTTTYSWSGPNGFTATTQNPSTTAPATAGSFVYSVSVQNSNGTGVCTATATTSLSVSTGCVPPTNVTASITPPTCAGATAQSNGILQLSGFTNEKYQYVTGNSFTGTATPASPTAIPSNSVLISTLANTAQTFTVRVYSATDNTCFIDRTVSLTPVVCNCPPPTCVPIGITVNN